MSGRDRTNWRKKRLHLIGMLGALVLASAVWPLDFFMVHDSKSEIYLTAPVLLGTTLHTRMLHSVQKTPVEDRYRVVRGMIISWQEWVQSHNAGLPSMGPRFGRFWYAPPWMVVEGGHTVFSTINYRVGTEEIGKNEAAVRLPWDVFGDLAWVPLYRLVPGKKLLFSIHSSPGVLGE